MQTTASFGSVPTKFVNAYILCTNVFALMLTGLRLTLCFPPLQWYVIHRVRMASVCLMIRAVVPQVTLETDAQSEVIYVLLRRCLVQQWHLILPLLCPVRSDDLINIDTTT